MPPEHKHKLVFMLVGFSNPLAEDRPLPSTQWSLIPRLCTWLSTLNLIAFTVALVFCETVRTELSIFIQVSGNLKKWNMNGTSEGIFDMTIVLQ